MFIELCLESFSENNELSLSLRSTKLYAHYELHAGRLVMSTKYRVFVSYLTPVSGVLYFVYFNTLSIDALLINYW